MSFHWRTPQEAAEAFRDILNKKWTKLVFADFRLKLFRSILENKSFRYDMKQCGALRQWTDENHLQWVITTNTIQESLTAIERRYGRTRIIEQSKLEIKQIVTELQSRTDTKNPDISAPLVKRAYAPSSGFVPPGDAYANQESSSSDDDSFNSLERKTVGGKPMEMLSPGKYIEIEEIIPQPILEYNEMHPIPLVIPFVVQKMKTWGCNILLPQKLTELFVENEIGRHNSDSTISYQELIRSISNSSTSNEIQRHENLTPLCKLDIFSCLTAHTDITVLSDLLRILSKFPQTLPLVLPNLDEQAESSAKATHILMYPALNNCLIRWETADGALAENYLFRSPYKLITAVRLGTNATGKSTILNQLFESSNTFQYRGQPGGERGVPFSVTGGSVEFIWLLENTCKASTWTAIQSAQSNSEHKSEIILLANMHGDVNKNLDILKAVSPMTSHFLVFVMPDAVKTLNIALDEVSAICGEKYTSILFVDPPENIRPPDVRVFKTLEIVRDETLQKLNKYIREGVQSSKSISYSTIGTVKIIDRIETPESQQLLNCILALTEQMEFQKEGLRDVLRLQHQIYGDANELCNVWSQSEDIQQLMSLFMNIMKLPLKSRRLAIGHLENELGILIATKSAKYANELRELTQLRNSYKLNPDHEYEIPLSEVYSEMKKIYVELGKSIGLDDLLRELGIVYEMMTSKPTTDMQMYTKLPEYYAEMLLEGMTLEILDGQLGSISGNWLESVCHSVCKKLPKLKVSVITILGLQSSGKSTLLNALFGCKFSVSVGKCTRGLFMRLMILEKSYRRKLKCDAIVVVDTEGLGAPENMIDKNAKMKDRMMATFAMTISNLTLINVLGEAKNEIAHIMQIVILVMARMDNTDLAPDILLVQHVTEGGQEYKLQQGVSQFCSALDEAVSVSKSEVVNLGVKTLNNLKNIKSRIKNQELLAQIRPFKNGASPQSPPTEGYHEDIIKLRRQIIVELTRKSHSQIPFCTWHKLLNSYWNAVQMHNFALRFIDIQQVQEYIEVNGRISTVKRNIDSAFLGHQRYLRGHINAKLSTWDLYNDVQSSKLFDDGIQQDIKRVLQFVPYTCEDPLNLTSKTSRCQPCLLAAKTTNDLMKYVKQTSSISVTETEENLKGYIADLQKTSIARMLTVFESAKIQAGKASEFEKILNDIIESDTITNEAQSADMTWNALLSRVEKLYPIKNVRQQIFKDILECYIQAPDIHLWQQELNRIPQTEDDPRIKLTIFAAKKRPILKKRTSLNLTANEHNWLCQKLAEIPQLLIAERNKQHQSYYSRVMIEYHKHYVLKVLRKFEQAYKTKLEERFRWEAILYSVQLLAEKLIQFQHKWDAANEPLLILTSEKVEYLKKIAIYLEPRRLACKKTNVSTIAASLAHKLLETAVVVTINAYSADKHFKSWTLKPEGIRLQYLIALAEHTKGGNEDVILEHFRNPRHLITEWYIMTIEQIVKDTQVPLLKAIFTEEKTAIITEILKTKTPEAFNTFVTWYLIKMKQSVAESEIISDEMFGTIKEAIVTELELRAKEYSDRICLENIPLDYVSFAKNIGCTMTCPQCSALCWGYKGHEDNLIRYKNHSTCHQPMGLAGLVDSTGTLIAKSCSDECDGDDEEEDEVLTDNRLSNESNDQYAVDVPWITRKHPVDEYGLLMQWFFFKLNKTLAKQYQATPASDATMKDLGYDTLDSQLDKILNVIRHKSEMC